MPLAFRCPASMRPELKLDEAHDAANAGTAAHEALRPLAEGRGVDFDDVDAIAQRYHADPDEVRMLCAMGVKLWREVRETFPGAITEADLELELDGATLTGHMDLTAITGDVARGADWKTGRLDSDHSEQMKAYGTLLLLTYPQLREATVTILWVRDGEIENYTMTRADAIAWVARVESEVIRWDGTYRPGSHCQHCPRSHECAAANAMARRDVAAISNKALVARVESEIATMQPAELITLVSKARAVEKMAKRVVDAVKEHVLARGDIAAPGVGRLTIQTEERRSVDPLKAWPVLEAEGFTDEDFAQVVTLGISKVERLTAKKAGKGSGAGAVRELQRRLTEAGAIETKEHGKLVQKRD